MKTSRFNRSIPLPSLMLVGTLAAWSPSAQAGNTWDGGAGTGNWGDANNWNADGAPAYGTVNFSGNTQTTTNNNSITSMNQVNWNGTTAWVMNGSSTLSLFDNGGTQAKLESFGGGGVTINAPITFAANNGSPANPYGEINAVNSDITFGTGTLAVNGSSVNGIKLFGGGRTTTFNNTVSASGKWIGLTGASTIMAVGGSFTSGDIYVMNGGTLKLNSGGAITTSALRLGGDFGNTGNQNQTLGGKLQFTSLTGGQSFAGVINTITGNTSNALLIDSLNTSGTNTLAGASFLDSDLKTQVASGGSLSFTGGSIDVKIRKLTVSGAGTTLINEAVTSSGTGGGLLVKEGTGTLILQGTSNTYTGTVAASLNANGTTINAGTLGIYGDGSLGLAPAGAYNNLQFTGSGTLQDTANNISLNATRNISIASGATATFDSNGNAFTINGIINGSGGLVSKIGGGTVTLAGVNTYTGATTVSAGKLAINGSTVAGSAFTVQTAGTLGGSGSIGGTVSVQSGGHFAPGNSISSSFATGALTLASGSFTDIELGTTGSSHASPGTSDRTAVSGALSLNGTLNVIDNNAANGNGSIGAGSYKIFTQTGTPTGSFSSVVNVAGYHAKVDTATSGSVYLDNYALATAGTIAAKDIGKARVGGTFSNSGALSISNATAANNGFTEGLNATQGSVTGGVISGGSSVSNLAGASSSTSLTAGFSTATSGAKSGTSTINLASSGTNSGGYADTSLGSQTVNISGTVYDLANAVFTQAGGSGSLTGGATSYTLDFGAGLAINTNYTASIQLANLVFSNASYQDALTGSYTASLAGVFGTTATNPGGLAAGSGNSFNITFNSGSTGSFSGYLNLGSLVSQQAGLADANLSNINIAITATAIPEPNAAMLAGGLGLLALLRRRRNG